MAHPIDNRHGRPHNRATMPTNFKSLLSDLKAIGFTQKQIADAIGSKQATISDLKTGRTKGQRVSYQTAEALKNFHAAQMKRARAA